jgi:hypothetical protein
MGEVIDLGEQTVPVAEKLERPWVFRAGWLLQDPAIFNGQLFATVILDLGFSIYRQVPIVIEGLFVPLERTALVIEFSKNWAENGRPSELEVLTYGRSDGQAWRARIRRAELDRDTLKVSGWESLVTALVNQGIAELRESDA